MIECHDTEVLLRFCERDRIRYRHIIHDLASPSPEWDDAMRRSDYIEGKGHVVNAYPTADPPKQTYYTEKGGESRLLICATGRTLRIEGHVREYKDFARWCNEFSPRRVGTTEKVIMDCVDQALGSAQWEECGGEYTATPQTFRPRIAVAPVRRLIPEDRPMWARFVDRYSHEPMVNSRPGSQAAVRDFEFMCLGLPVKYYVTIDDNEISGFLTVNRFTTMSDEIPAVFVPPENRRNGLAASLLSAATKDILAQGRLPGYHAAGSPSERPDLFHMLAEMGYFLVSVPWQR